MAYRSFHFLLIEILLIIILLIAYYHGSISDRSMAICLLGTYIIFKWLFVAIYMYFYPFKCGDLKCI